jgi:hypothetical protein
MALPAIGLYGSSRYTASTTVWQCAQQAAREETFQVQRLAARDRGQDLVADQVPAEDEEQVDPAPADIAGEAEDRVLDDEAVVVGQQD